MAQRDGAVKERQSADKTTENFMESGDGEHTGQMESFEHLRLQLCALGRVLVTAMCACLSVHTHHVVFTSPAIL